jgi:hypothetical protein
MITICYKWGNCNIHWADANWFWSKCLQIVPPGPPTGSLHPPGVEATVLIQPWLTEPWNPYKQHDSGSFADRKRLIRLICKVKGETYEEEKMVSNMKISVDDIRMVIKAITDVDVDIKFEE